MIWLNPLANSTSCSKYHLKDNGSIVSLSLFLYYFFSIVSKSLSLRHKGSSLDFIISNDGRLTQQLHKVKDQDFTRKVNLEFAVAPTHHVSFILIYTFFLFDKIELFEKYLGIYIFFVLFLIETRDQLKKFIFLRIKLRYSSLG